MKSNRKVTLKDILINLSKIFTSKRFLSPLILLHNLRLLLRREIILNVEELPYLRDRSILDEWCNLSTWQLQQWLNVQVIGCQDHLKEHLLIQVDKLSIPWWGHIIQVVGSEWLLNLRGWIGIYVLAELDNLLQDGALDVREGDLLIDAWIIDHAFD